MAEPSQIRFTISGPTAQCTEAPKDKKKDPCRVTVWAEKSGSEFSFGLQRKDGKFQIEPQDLRLQKKLFPQFRLEQSAMQDFIKVQRRFYKRYGDAENTTTLTDNIKVLNKPVIFEILNSTANFLAFGKIKPTSPKDKVMMESAIAYSIAAFADPTFGSTMIQVLEDIKADAGTNAKVKERIDFLLQVSHVREALWQLMDPVMSKSKALSMELRGSTWQLVHFLMAEHVLADKGYKQVLGHKRITRTAQVYHNIMSQLPNSDYTVEKNYYHFLSQVMKDVGKKVQLPQGISGDFQRRVGLAESAYRKEASKETLRLLPKEQPIPAFQISLRIKYADDAWKRQALETMLDNIDIKVRKGQPYYIVKMASIDKALREWYRGLPEQQKGEAMAATLYLIDQLLERGEKIDAFWDGKWTKVDSFFGSDSFGKGLFGGNNNKLLQDLIDDLRGQSRQRDIPLSPDAEPHTHFRKWTFLSEGIGTGLGVGSYFIPYSDDPMTTYNARFGSSIAIGTGVGALAGNGLSYALDIDSDYAWLFDIGGGILGGLAAGLIYNAAASKPMSPMEPPIMMPPDPGERNPVDPYGP